VVYHEMEGNGRHVDLENDEGESLLQLQSIHRPGFHHWPFEQGGLTVAERYY
jgi:hypothetical protein